MRLHTDGRILRLKPRRVILACCLTLFFPAMTVAHGQSSSRTAVIEGDVYLVMQNGDTKRGAGVTVYLRRATSSLFSNVGAICEADSQVSHRLAREYLLDIDEEKKALTANTLARLADRPEDIERLARVRSAIDSLEHLRSVDRRVVVAMMFDREIIQAQGEKVSSGMNAHYSFTGLPPGDYVVYAMWTMPITPINGGHPLRCGSRSARELTLTTAGKERVR